jgi:hypothetical protein
MRRLYESRASTILFHLLRSAARGEPWLLPANVCPIVPLTFLAAGTPFELVDIDRRTLCIDGGELLRRLAARPAGYAGLLFVRTYGVDEDAEALLIAIKAAMPRLLLVDDRCLCRPDFDARPDGAADVLLYSTGYAKTVDVGFGGFAQIKEEVAYRPSPRAYREEELERLTARYKRAIERREPLREAAGDWLDTRPPALPFDEYRELIEGKVEASYEQKRRINAIYRAAVPAESRLDDRFQDWRFHLLVDDKQRLLDAIFAAGLFASSHYADLSPVFGAGSGPGAAPVAERLHRRVVNLFNDGYFNEEQARRAAELVRAHLARSAD